MGVGAVKQNCCEDASTVDVERDSMVYRLTDVVMVKEPQEEDGREQKSEVVLYDGSRYTGQWRQNVR